MHIVQVYYSKCPVSFYGGMERVIESLCEGFIESGHKVTLMSLPGDYQISGVNHIDIYNADPFTNLPGFKKLLPENIDFIHFHLPHKLENFEFPHIFTMHGNLRPDQLLKDLPHNTIFLSKDHAQRHGSESFVYNGLNFQKIPIAKLEPNHKKNHCFSFLGRASLKRKGLHLAKKISKKFKMPLKVGGKQGISFSRWVKYLGNLDNTRKYQLLGQSSAMLFPILWDEPFGLVMIEAMFCGTPVFALNRGSVKEVLGQAGSDAFFIYENDYDALCTAIENYHYKNNSIAIRDYAIQHFSHHRMCENYLQYYKS